MEKMAKWLVNELGSLPRNESLSVKNTFEFVDKIKVYMNIAKICIAQNCFQFRNEFYQIENGTSMGNSFSRILAEVFMATFELKLLKVGKLPRIWLRYDDDVYAIFKRSEMDSMLDVLNSQCESINFTKEVEIDNKIAFLDLTICRTNDGIDIAVHHKDTSTLRYITINCGFTRTYAT